MDVQLKYSMSSTLQCVCTSLVIIILCCSNLDYNYVTLHCNVFDMCTLFNGRELIYYNINLFNECTCSLGYTRFLHSVKYCYI